ncbi:MAG: hypothetical protein ACFB21_06580 [Opitutales bacterium]
MSQKFLSLLGGLAAIALMGATTSALACPCSGKKNMEMAAPTLQVTPVAKVEAGQAVVLRGIVASIGEADHFVLRDASGTVNVAVTGEHLASVKAGDIIVVLGTAAENEITAERLVLANGSTLDVAKRVES